jgi:hypothetical protein
VEEERDHNISRFENESQGLKEVLDAFNEWCEIFTSHSLHTAYAIIAANWAVYSRKVLINPYAKWSLIIIISFLAINLIITYLMTYLHFKQSCYGEDNPDEWQKDYKTCMSRTDVNNYWPYTFWIVKLGSFLRLLKLACPLVAAVLFIISFFL